MVSFDLFQIQHIQRDSYYSNQFILRSNVLVFQLEKQLTLGIIPNAFIEDEIKALVEGGVQAVVFDLRLKFFATTQRSDAELHIWISFSIRIHGW